MMMLMTMIMLLVLWVIGRTFEAERIVDFLFGCWLLVLVLVLIIVLILIPYSFYFDEMERAVAAHRFVIAGTKWLRCGCKLYIVG